MERLRLELDDKRREGAAVRQQKAFAALLSQTNEMYDAVRRARRRRRLKEISDSQFVAELQAISAHEGQVALEELRLLASTPTAACADALWHHLRSEEVPAGRELSSESWVAWKQSYWDLRHRLVASCRSDLDNLTGVAVHWQTKEDPR